MKRKKNKNKKEKSRERDKLRNKEGRIHGETVADSWAGAVMQKPLEKFCDGPTDQPTRQGELLT